MYEQDKDVSDDQLLGIQEAAIYLGMHRATLLRAVNTGIITPDSITPKGRSRFRLETLQTFQHMLRRRAATSREHIYGPVKIIANLASLLTDATGTYDKPQAVVLDTLHQLCIPQGNFDMACVVVRVPSETDSYAIKILEEVGVPASLIAAYTHLRPLEVFPVTVALQTGELQKCDGSEGHAFPNSTVARVLAQHNIVSYAAVPLITVENGARETIGALVVCGRAPHTFTRQERVFLGGVADALSACIMHGSLDPLLLRKQGDPLLLRKRNVPLLTPAMALDTVSRLQETAFSRLRDPAAELPIESLCDLLVDRSNALVALVDGFPSQDCGNTSALSQTQNDKILCHYRDNLQTLVQRTRTADELKREQWESRVTAVALPVALPSGRHGAVGAVWPGVREELTSEKAVLTALASACSMVAQYTAQGDG